MAKRLDDILVQPVGVQVATPKPCFFASSSTQVRVGCVKKDVQNLDFSPQTS